MTKKLKPEHFLIIGIGVIGLILALVWLSKRGSGTTSTNAQTSNAPAVIPANIEIVNPGQTNNVPNPNNGGGSQTPPTQGPVAPSGPSGPASPYTPSSPFSDSSGASGVTVLAGGGAGTLSGHGFGSMPMMPPSPYGAPPSGPTGPISPYPAPSGPSGPSGPISPYPGAFPRLSPQR